MKKLMGCWLLFLVLLLSGCWSSPEATATPTKTLAAGQTGNGEPAPAATPTPAVAQPANSSAQPTAAPTQAAAAPVAQRNEQSNLE